MTSHESKKQELLKEISKFNSLKKLANSSHRLLYVWGERRYSLLVLPPLTLEIKSQKSPNGEALYFQVSDFLGLVMSYPIFIPLTSLESGQTVMSLCLSFDESKKNTTISSPTANTNPSPN